MKNILLATDFSSNAHIAALCAGEITCRIGGRLIFLHVLSPAATLKGKEHLTENSCLEEVTQKKLDTLAHEVYSRFGISVSRLLIPGLAEKQIPDLAERLKAELLIIGAQGENGGTNKALGRLATEMLKQNNFPVVCVPAEPLLSLGIQLVHILAKKQQMCNDGGFALLTDLNKLLNAQKPLPK